MANTDLLQQLSNIFRQSGPAHHQAYIHTNGHDPEWPLWYASYLCADLNRLLAFEFTQSELVYALVAVEKQRQKKEPNAYWPDYYARFFIENYYVTDYQQKRL